MEEDSEKHLESQNPVLFDVAEQIGYQGTSIRNKNIMCLLGGIQWTLLSNPYQAHQ